MCVQQSFNNPTVLCSYYSPEHATLKFAIVEQVFKHPGYLEEYQHKLFFLVVFHNGETSTQKTKIENTRQRVIADRVTGLS